MLSYNTFENLDTKPQNITLETKPTVTQNPFNTNFVNEGIEVTELEAGGWAMNLPINTPMGSLPTFASKRNNFTIGLSGNDNYDGKFLEIKQVGVKDTFYSIPLKIVEPNTLNIQEITDELRKYELTASATIDDISKVTYITFWNNSTSDIVIGVRTPFVNDPLINIGQQGNGKLINNEMVFLLTGRTYNDISLSSSKFNYYRNKNTDLVNSISVNGSTLTEEELTEQKYKTQVGNLSWVDIGGSHPVDVNYSRLDLTAEIYGGNDSISVQLGSGLFDLNGFNNPLQTTAATYWDTEGNVISPNDPTKWVTGPNDTKAFKFDRAQLMFSKRLQFNRASKSDTISHFEVAPTSKWRVRNAKTGDFSQELDVTALQAYLTGVTVEPITAGNVAFDIVNEYPQEDFLQLFQITNTAFLFAPGAQDNLALGDENTVGSKINLYLGPGETAPIECTPSHMELSTTATIDENKSASMSYSINGGEWETATVSNIGDGSVYSCWTQLVASNNMLQYIINTKFTDFVVAERSSGIAGLPGTPEKTVETTLAFRKLNNPAVTDMFEFMTEHNEVITDTVMVTSCGSLD